MKGKKAIRIDEKLWTKIMRLKYKEKRVSVGSLVEDMYSSYTKTMKDEDE